MNKEQMQVVAELYAENDRLERENKELNEETYKLSELWCKLQQENKELHDKIDKAIKRIELLGKFDGERCTRNFKMMSADFNYLLEILKNGDVDE